MAPVVVAYLSLNRFYAATARELKRLEAVAKSPVYGAFSEALDGLPTIRAYGYQSHLTSCERHSGNPNP